MSQENFKEIINNEIKGAENAVKKMLFYYISALESSGVEDVKQYVATQISKLIDLSEEQYRFVIANLNSDSKIIDSLNNCIVLLEDMENNKKLDLQSISIIKNALNAMVNDCKDFDRRD